MADRQTLYCVPIPAECQWVKKVSSLIIFDTSKLVRLNIVSNQSLNTMGEPVQAIFPDRQPCLKHKYEEAMEDGGMEFCAKRRCLPTETSSNDQKYDLNFPIPGEKGLPCMVKV